MEAELIAYLDDAFGHLCAYITICSIGICAFIGLIAYWLKDGNDSVKSVLDKYNINREEFDYIMETASKKLKSGEMHIVTSDDVKEAARRVLARRSNREND